MPAAEPLPGGDSSKGGVERNAGTESGLDDLPADIAEHEGSPEKEAEHVAASLLEILARPDNAINPHVRSMAMDTLQALLPEIGTPGFLRMLARRLCLMERPPASLLRTLLAGHDPEITHTLLLDARMPESLLVEIAEGGEPEVLHVLARRRRLSTAVCNALLKSDAPDVMLELLRNRNAVIEEHGYWAVVRHARNEPGLHAPLVTRDDLPAAVAFDLFWHLPPMQRRFVISRFVSDSDMLERILKIVRPTIGESDAADRAMRIETMIAMICDGDTDAAARRLSRLTGLHEDASRRIVSDTSGEALTITFKALGLQRRVFTDVIDRIRNAPASSLDGRRETDELKILFDTLSTNKSWVMLTYWDWSARGIGPYSDRETPSPDDRHHPSAIATVSRTENAAPGAGEPASETDVAEADAEAQEAETSPKAPEPEDPVGTDRAEADEEREEEELPDDPLKRIDALLRQLQKAAGASSSSEDAEGRVA